MPLLRSLVRSLALGFPLALALPLAGCAPESDSEPDEEIGIYGQPIKGGYTDSTDTGVVGIVDVSIGAQCTGSLIAPNVVLTARHCVSNTAATVQCGKAAPGPLHAAKYFYVTTLPNLFSQDGADYHAVREVIGLPLDLSSPDPLLNKEDLCGRDQAILILADNMPASEAVPYVPRVDSELAVGEEYYAVGYGATEDTGAGAGVRRRRDNLEVYCVADGCPAAYVKKTEFVGDTGICQGDSGGPSLDMANRVIGTTSRGGAGCVSPVYGYVFAWGQWLKDVVRYAAGESIGNYPVPGWVDGKSTDPAYSGDVTAKCDAPECTSHICINTGGDLGEHCTHKCDAINTCPEGFECSATYGDLCVEKAKPTPEPKPEDETDDEDDKADPQASGGCALAGKDPTKPIPWKAGGFVVAAAAALAARRRRRDSDAR